MIALVIAALPTAGRTAALDPYRVDDVRVDATAKNASQAREQALAQGQRLALDRLLRRLTLRRDLARLPRPGGRQITDLVAGVEVNSERASNVRYIAELSVRFKPAAVRALMRDGGIDFVETPSKPVLVLPVYVAPAGPVLWDEPNPWRHAWARLALRGGLVPFVQALGDLSDFQLIDAGLAVENDALSLSRIAERYEAAHVLIVTARLRPSGDAGQVVAEVSVSRFDLSDQETRPVGAFRGAVGADRDKVLESTAAAIAAEIEERWKVNNVVLSGPESRLVVRTEIADFADWREVRRRLGTVALVRGDRLLRLSRRRADLEITYLGDVGRLAQALAQNNLVLVRSQRSATAAPLAALGQPRRPDWTLRLGGEAAETRAAPEAQ